jgi:hypothetical protein
MLHEVITQIAPGKPETPLLKRFAAKLMVDVLPAAFVSVLGGFIVTTYQFNHTAASHPASEQVVPASAEMMQLVRDEHSMIVDYVKAQIAAEKSRNAAEDAASADARAAAAADAAAPVAAPPVTTVMLPQPRPAVVAVVAAKPVTSRKVAAAPAAPTTPPHAPLLIAQAAAPAGAASSPDAAPESKSLLTRTLEVKDQVVGATMHAVSAIGSIPSWIASMGDRIGGSDTTSSSAGRFATSL